VREVNAQRQVAVLLSQQGEGTNPNKPAESFQKIPLRFTKV
jgi:hypothetical protein